MGSPLLVAIAGDRQKDNDPFLMIMSTIVIDNEPFLIIISTIVIDFMLKHLSLSHLPKAKGANSVGVQDGLYVFAAVCRFVQFKLEN